MIKSMTSFYRSSQDDGWGHLTWEIRTVNHRYLELNLRCPDLFRPQENHFRELIQKYLSRGKVDATLKFIPGEQFTTKFNVNKSLVAELAKADQAVRHYFPNATTNMMDLLEWRGVLQVNEEENKPLQEHVQNLLKQNLQELVLIREREGSGLKKFMLNNLQQIDQEVVAVKERLPEVLKNLRGRLSDRLKELEATLDNQRLEQEMLLLAQRADVAEEVQRLSAHLDEVRRILDSGGVVGRRLDFLMQELNREANTLGSKSMDIAMTQSAVEMKVLIEQIREQVQNIE